MGRRLEGQTAWISGAASGIGEATARLFAEEGANVALADVQVERGEAVRAAIAARGGNALFLPVDVSVEEDVRDSIAETVAKFGGLNILVNCAGLVHVGLAARVRRGGLGPADGGQRQVHLLLGQARAAVPAAEHAGATS